MTTFYSQEWSTGSLGEYRAKCVYSVSSTSTTTTVSGTLSLQYKGPGRSGSWEIAALVVVDGTYYSTSKATFANASSTYYDVKSIPFSYSFTRTTANQSKTIEIDYFFTTLYAGSSKGSSSFTVPVLQSWSVSYDANGGSGAPSAQKKYYNKTLTLSSAKPSRADATAATYTVTYDHNYSGSSNATATAKKTSKYTFSKWNTAQGGGGTNYNPGGSYTANSGAILYAQWTSSSSTASITLRTPTRTGYTFGGWYKEAACTTKVGNAGASYTPTASIRLYAKWTINTYTVSYNANGGSGAPSAQTKTYGTTLTLSSTIPTRTNYVFRNWNTASGGTGTSYNPSASYTTNAAATLYAQWYAPYTITYKANGASGSDQTQTKVYNTAATLKAASTYSRTGYTFSKWNTAANGTGTAYSAGASYTTNANITLYAQWTANKYTISFNANGGVSAPSSITKTYGQNATLPTAKPTRVGHTFLGWAETSSATTAKWASGGTFSDAITANKTLYAVWRDDYTAPQITSFKVFRCDSQGAEDDAGTYAKVQAAWSIDTTVDEGVTNSGTVTGTIAEEGSAASAFTFSSGDTGTSGTAIAIIPNLDVNLQYTVKVTVTDVKGASKATTRTALVLRAFYIMDFGNAGQSVGIGRAASNDGMEVGYETTFDENVTNYKQLMCKSMDIDRDGTEPSSITDSTSYFRFVDVDNELLGLVNTRRYPDGRQSLILQSSNENTGNTGSVVNYIMLHVDRNDNKTYTVSEPAAFRDAISAMTRTSTAADSGSDLDDMAVGECWWGSNLVNGPLNSSTYTMAFRIGSLQIAYHHQSGNEIRLFARNYINSAWSPWVRCDSKKESTTTASSIATAASNVTLGSCSYAERGGVAMFSVQFTPSADIASATTVFTLVSGKRPAIACNGVDSSTTYSCTVNTGGTVQCRRALTKNTSYTFRATYLLA